MDNSHYTTIYKLWYLPRVIGATRYQLSILPYHTFWQQVPKLLHAAVYIHHTVYASAGVVYLGLWVCVPVGACSADLGMVALSRGTVLVSGSGVLIVGDVGTGLGTTRGFLFDRKTHTVFGSFTVEVSQKWWCLIFTLTKILYIWKYVYLINDGISQQWTINIKKP